jgi:hypothetical protein
MMVLFLKQVHLQNVGAPAGLDQLTCSLCKRRTAYQQADVDLPAETSPIRETRNRKSVRMRAILTGPGAFRNGYNEGRDAKLLEYSPASIGRLVASKGLYLWRMV